MVRASSPAGGSRSALPIYFIGKDGIYQTVGGVAQSGTDDTLYALFPHDGIAGRSVNGINPPDFTQPNMMQLEYADGYSVLRLSRHRRRVADVGLTNIDASGVRRQGGCLTPTRLVFARTTGRRRARVHSIIMGGVDGRLYQYCKSVR